MGDIFRHLRSEIKQLPFMLGKLLGGALAVLGFSAAVVVLTRRPGTTPSDVPLYFLAAITGVVIFVTSSRALARRMKQNSTQSVPPGDSRRMSMVSWTLLLLLAAVLLLVTFLVTR